MKKITFLLVLAVIFASCSKNPQPTMVQPTTDEIGIKLSSSDFNATGSTAIETLDAYLFVNEVLARVYTGLTVEDQKLQLPIVHYDGINASLYMAANTKGVTSSLNDPSSLVVGSTKESDFPLYFSGDANITPIPLPLGSRTDLSNINVAEPLQVKLQHAHAHLVMKIEEENVEITKIEFKNLPKNGSLISDQKQSSNYTGPLFDFTKEYPTPVTTSQTVGYINEGNGLNIPVTIYCRFNGIEAKMALKLPAQIKRNTTYTIKITKVGATLTAIVTVEDWENGGETDATPDVTTRVLFKSESSVLPNDIHYSATLDTLYVPSDRDSDLILALNADYEIEAEISGNSSGIQLTPADGFNRFQVQVNAQQAGASAYYSYLKIKNKFFENYYGERLVVMVAPNYNAPIADVDLLATIPGIQLSGSLACVVPYGSSTTIPAAKLKANDRIFSTIQNIQVLSAPNTSYKAIKLMKNGDNLVIQSVQNTTGEPQAVTGIVSGISTDGNPVAAIMSITIPAVPANELAAFNSLCVLMGGNTWMQFNTSGTYAGDIQNAVAISKLGEINFDKIKNNYTRFGFYKTNGTYDTANPCPSGFRNPSSQEFLNLLGVANTAGLSVLGSVAAAPVNTPGGMTVSHKLFKGASNYSGEGAISIQKDGQTVWLTNGRFIATPNRTFFEFWHAGSFSIGQAASNVYNWTRRCVKVANYNGLQ